MLLTKTKNEHLIEILESIDPLVKKLLEHKLYYSLDSNEKIKLFMEYHIFAVWDFMNLLKHLQRNLTCISIPWLPTNDSHIRRLINEIVTDEESDNYSENEVASHFELYYNAMKEANADTICIDFFISQIREGKKIENILLKPIIPKAVRNFINVNWLIINKEPIHSAASAFVFGRESIIPLMFAQFAKELNYKNDQFNLFNLYLERHISLDKSKHQEKAFKILTCLCDNDSTKWEDVKRVATTSMEARLELWDSILESTIMF